MAIDTKAATRLVRTLFLVIVALLILAIVIDALMLVVSGV